MSDQGANEEREAMIAAGRGRALEPHEADELALLADLLADPSTWAEPRAGLEDEVVRSIATAPAVRVARPRTWRFAGAAAAVAAAIAISVGLVGMVGSTDPDFEAKLSATALAPAARASAAVTHSDAGFRIRLDAHGLPRLGAGEYYQAWLKNAKGIGVPIGTFSSSDDRVTLWSGVSPKAFPSITVTREKADNDQSSSGLVVLAGNVRSR
jgi:hypothetical protein